MVGGSQVVSIVIYYFRDLPMGLLFKIYATSINIPKKTFRGSKYETGSFSGLMGSRFKFFYSGGLFNEFFSLAAVEIVKSAKNYADNKYNILSFIWQMHFYL